MQAQEIQAITKETHKTVLKTICESPILSLEDLVSLLKNRGKSITQEEVLQVIHSISPNKNWHRATQDDIQKEILEYLWILESQVLFLLPTKQKETTIAEFNQQRLQNKQPKVPKDIVRHVQTLLSVEGKNLAKFRKFQKELTIQNDLDTNTQASWALRIILSDLDLDSINSIQDLSITLPDELKERFPAIFEKVGKTNQRLTERLIEKYFPQKPEETRLKELLTSYQKIYNTYKKTSDGEVISQNEFNDQNKLIQNIISQLTEVQNIISESHEGGFLSKLLTGQIKNKEGIIKKVNGIVSSLNQLNDSNNKTNKNINEKVLVIQKLQSDYENIVLVKNQLESDLYTINEKISTGEEKSSNLEKENHDKTESLEKAHEKIATLQQKIDKIPEIESRANMLREELNVAKEIALRLYSRVQRIKSDLLKQYNDKPKVHERPKPQKEATDQKTNNGNHTIHKVIEDPETGETTITTETN